MAIHMGIERRHLMFKLSEHPLSVNGGVGNRLVCILALAILIGVTISAWWAGMDTAPSVALQQSVTDSLSQDTTERLARTSMSAWGDLEIEFALRDQGDAEADRVAALADSLAIARSVSQAPAPRPINNTLLGVWRPAPTASPVPLLYASLPADRLVGLDWARVQPDDLTMFGVVRWLPTGLCQAWHDCGAGIK